MKVLEAIKSALTNHVIAVTADGIKSFTQLFTELFNALPSGFMEKCTRAKIRIGDAAIYDITTATSSAFTFNRNVMGDQTKFVCFVIVLSATSVYAKQENSNGTMSYTDMSSDVPTDGTTISLVY